MEGNFVTSIPPPETPSLIRPLFTLNRLLSIIAAALVHHKEDEILLTAASASLARSLALISKVDLVRSAIAVAHTQEPVIKAAARWPARG